MLQVAVFVDAGYLYAQGSALLAGAKQPRASIRLSVGDVLSELIQEADELASPARLLRIYWYDGLLRANLPTSEQDEIARSPDAKLRLGAVNPQGQQKGVDSPIVTDLIELARNRAIGDALILSGDEDIRIGVQVAQTFGVRIHLLGIAPSRGSQSFDLIREADTHREWDANIVGRWMTVQPETTRADRTAAPSSRPESADPSPPTEFGAIAVDESRIALSGLGASDIERFVGYLDRNGGLIPSEIDRPTLARLRNRLGRDLADDERKEYRRIFASALRAAEKS